METVHEVRARIREVSAAETLRGMNPGTVLLDVREPGEWNMAHIPGAVFIPQAQLEEKVETLIPRDKQVVVYCRSGNRSVFAADTLQELGYTNVASMAGGIGAWVDAGGEVE